MNSKFKIQNSKLVLSEVEGSKNKGLSLIEAVVAIAILTMGLIGALALATFGIVAGGESKMRVTAINLAREGAEVVRNIRDSNWLRCGEGCWLEGEAGIEDDIPYTSAYAIPKFDSNYWTLIGEDVVFDPTNPDSTYQIGIDGDGLYVQPAGASKTNFYRALDIQEVQAGTELKVTCYVAYQERGRWHLVNVEDHLFNWY